MIRVISILIWYQLVRGAEVGGPGGSGISAGNTSFVEGASWCIAHPGAAEMDVQNALDWACGMGRADCSPIRAPSGHCFHPDTLLAHASFAFNTYYQQNGNSHIACNFGGTAFITRNDPSYDRCIYDSSASASVLSQSSASRPSSPDLLNRAEVGVKELAQDINLLPFTPLMRAEKFVVKRLKHMVDNKIHSRGQGNGQILTRQPAEGWSRAVAVGSLCFSKRKEVVNSQPHGGGRSRPTCSIKSR